MKEDNLNLKDKKLELLKEAIRDTQSIISMLDLKARFLLAINLAFIGGILLLIRGVLGIKDIHHLNFIMKIIFIFSSIGIVLYSLFIIWQLIYKVINPRNQPFNKIKNTDKQYNESPFFPVPKENCFDFNEWKEKIDSYDEKDIFNIYLLELLKVSYIRDLKIKELNKIINNHFKWLLNILFIYTILIICFFILTK